MLEERTDKQGGDQSIDPDPPRLLRATCAPALSDYLAREIEDLGHRITKKDHTGVEMKGTMVDAMRLVLRLRTAYHLLQRFADLKAADADRMYEAAVRLPWERVIPHDGYISVVSHIQNETIRNTMFANVRLKDAIVDRMQQINGHRPDAGSNGDRTVVHLFWQKDFCRISLDLAGQKLSDRSYRRIPSKAPMRETIAAAVLARMEYDGSRPLVVPMCGSGTIAIEAALIATGRAPGLLRSNFGIKHLRTFDESAWKSERALAKKEKRSEKPAPIIASDLDPLAVSAAKKNAVTAGVDHLITFEVCDFADTTLPEQPGSIILHGEYGERLGVDEELEPTYGRIGDYLKQRCGGWQGWVFTSREFAGSVGLKTADRITFQHGGIECRLLKFDLYSGSRSDPGRSFDA